MAAWPFISLPLCFRKGMDCAPLHCLRDAPGHDAAGRPTPRATQQDARATDAAIVCRACGHMVTSARQRLEVQGAHAHRFMNPGGFLFHIGCFAEAVGCVVVGPDSLEYPWFAGFAWRCAQCGGCGAQLGWHFRNDDHTAGFFGLVLDRLIEAGDDPAP
jgi:hypothetical protein